MNHSIRALAPLILVFASALGAQPVPADVRGVSPAGPPVVLTRFGVTMHYARPFADGSTFVVTLMVLPNASTPAVRLGWAGIGLSDGPILDVRPYPFSRREPSIREPDGADCASQSQGGRVRPSRLSVSGPTSPQQAASVAIQGTLLAWQFFGTSPGIPGYPLFCDCAVGTCTAGGGQTCSLASFTATPVGDIVVEGQLSSDRSWWVYLGAVQLSCVCSCQ